jgi:hypothetical protein
MLEEHICYLHSSDNEKSWKLYTTSVLKTRAWFSDEKFTVSTVNLIESLDEQL